MRKSVFVLAIALLASVSMAQFTEDFEGEDLTSLTDAGWVLSPWGDPVQFVAIETTIVHSGSQALVLPQSCRAAFPLGGDGFGTLNIWVYDNGDVYDAGNIYGPVWGISKGVNWIGGSIQDRSWLGDDVAYSVSLGAAGDILGSSLYSPTWLDAGLGGAERSRGVAGWMNWEVTYYENGEIQIDLLSDPNGCDSRRGAGTFGAEGKGDPAADGTFADVGGADSIYILGGRSASPLDSSVAAYGNLIVDDITWTPAGSNNPGDVDGDGDVDISDFLILKGNYGKTTGAVWGEGDMDEDGDVDITDFLILKGAYGTTY